MFTVDSSICLVIRLMIKIVKVKQWAHCMNTFSSVAKSFPGGGFLLSCSELANFPIKIS